MPFLFVMVKHVALCIECCNRAQTLRLKTIKLKSVSRLRNGGVGTGDAERNILVLQLPYAWEFAVWRIFSILLRKK